jgi:hypothetical protein
VIQTALDFENVVESAVSAVLQSVGLNVFTTSEVFDFKKDRPRVQVQFTLGIGQLQWVNPAKLPADFSGARVESAWTGSLHTTIVTSAQAEGKQDQSDIRSLVRFLYLNLAQRLNGNILTLHKINLVKESGSARSIHPNDSNSEVLQMVHDLNLSVHESVWSSYTRITQDGSIRVSSVRVTN